MRHLNVGPHSNWLLASTEIPISRLDGGIDHNKMITKISAEESNIYFLNNINQWHIKMPLVQPLR